MDELEQPNSGLDWSFMLGAEAEILDKDGNALGTTYTPDYLFRPDERFSLEFWEIEREMAQLNDYCLLSVSETGRHLQQMRRECADLMTGKKRYVFPEDDFTGEQIDWLTEQIGQWEDTYGFIAKAMCLLLLSAFLEKTLRGLITALSPAGLRLAKERSGEGKVAQLLASLKTECRLSFDEPSDSYAVRDVCRKLRNDFAHGEWDKVRRTVHNLSLRDAFSAVTQLLTAVEAAAWESDWGRRTQ